MATITVTSLSDSGAGTLRAAITTANGASGDTINFTGLSGKITLASALPAITAPMTIAGAGASVVIDGAGEYCPFTIDAPGDTVTIENLTIQHGLNAGEGGAIVNTAGTLNLTNCSLLSNTSNNHGGALQNTATAVVTGCTFSGNTATGTFDGGAINNTGTLTVTNSTFHGNTSGRQGGAISNDYATAATITNCTFTANSTGELGGAAVSAYYCPVTIKNCIAYADEGIEFGGTITATYCCVEVGFAGTGNISTNPVLGSLSNNGGSTQTIPILTSSPAAAAATATGAPVADQRGFTRPATPSMGAYEAGPAAPTGLTLTSTTISGDTPNPFDDTAALTYSVYSALHLGALTDSGRDGLAAGAAWSISALSPGTEYDVSYYAVNAAGAIGGASASVWTLPTAPGALTLTAVGNTEVNVGIPALSGGAASYNLRRAPDSAGSPGAWATIDTGVAPSSTYPDTTVSADTNYWYQLVAVNGGGGTSNGTAASVTTGESIPQSVTCASTPHGPLIGWSAAPGASTYTVLRSAHAENTFSSLATGITVLSYTDGSAVAGTVYDYEVESVTGGTTSAPSAIVSGAKLISTANLIFSTGILMWYPVTDVQAAILLSGSPLAADRVNNSGESVTGTAANMVDGNTGTTGSINSHVAGANTETSTDYVEVDLSAPFGVTGVNVNVSAGTLQTVNVWSADAQGLYPGGPGTTLLGSFVASVGVSTVTPAQATPGRYLLIESVYATAEVLTIAEITVNVYPGVLMAFVQDCGLKETFKREDAFESAIVNVAPLDCQDGERKTVLTVDNLDIQILGLQLLLAANLASKSGGTVQELSSPITVSFPKMSMNYHLLTTDGRNVDMVFNAVKPKGDNLELKRANYAVQKMELDCYENSQGDVWSILVDD